MASRFSRAKEIGLIKDAPKWIADNVHYEVLTGSVAYGCSSDTSDMDIVGFVIPPKGVVFPHLSGMIHGFGKPPELFNVFQKHHVKDDAARKEYDFTMYSIVKFFQLCMENNPNMIDTLFVPQRCVLFASKIGQRVRDERKMFLHKGAFGKFRGYALSQLHKLDGERNAQNPKRAESIAVHGFDVKFAYHIVRLALECEQILVEGDLDLERNSEILKSIRRGEWSKDRIKEWFATQEIRLNELKATSKLREVPDEAYIKHVLLTSLEDHYGSLTDAIREEIPVENVLREIQAVIDKYR